MKSILAVLLFLQISFLYAQENEKNRSLNKLTWDDFQEKEEAEGASRLDYLFGFHMIDKKRINDTIFHGLIDTYAYVDKRKSWVNKNYKNSQYLRYNQVVFDITELHRRKLQNHLNSINVAFEANIIFNEYQTNLKNEINRFQKQSKRGKNLNTIAFWEDLIAEQLSQQKVINTPTINKKNLGLGMFVGLDTGMFTDKLHEHFENNALNLIYGFDVAYKKHILFINGTLGSSKTKKDFTIAQNNWPNNKKTIIALIDLSYGYALIDNKSIKFSPFTGLGITEISVSNNNSDEGLRLVDYNLIFGINTDYKIWKRVNLIPNLMGGRGYNETSIRMKLFASKANYTSAINGYSINLAVGISWFGNPLK